MSDEVLLVVLVSMVIGFVFYQYKNQQSRQLKFIEKYSFHPAIRSKLLKKHPDLKNEQLDLVFRGLRDYFYMCNRARRRMVSMPSQVVDDAWHEFILFTKTYQRFCRRAVGRFLHHTPAEAMRTPTLAQDGIKRAWRLACAKEGIDPALPDKLPLIFAIDGLLNIKNGFIYAADCKNSNSPHYGTGYCGSHIGCGGGCTGDSGAVTGDSGGFFDGLGGDGGSGCGGGCGGD